MAAFRTGMEGMMPRGDLRRSPRLFTGVLRLASRLAFAFSASNHGFTRAVGANAGPRAIQVQPTTGHWVARFDRRRLGDLGRPACGQ